MKWNSYLSTFKSCQSVVGSNEVFPIIHDEKNYKYNPYHSIHFIVDNSM